MKKMILEQTIKVESGLEEIEEFIEKKITNKHFNVIDLENEINAILSGFNDSENKSLKMELSNDLEKEIVNSFIGTVKLSSEDTFFIEVYFLPTNAGPIFIIGINVEWL